MICRLNLYEYVVLLLDVDMIKNCDYDFKYLMLLF